MRSTRDGLPLRYRTAAPRRVLLAEDDPDMRELMAHALRRDGWEVLEAGDGEQALDTLGTTRADDEPSFPDLVVTDVQMPGCTGLEMLARLRRGASHVPVILVTAFGDRETHYEARRLGALVLDKPFELDDLRALVFDALEPRS